MKTIASLSAVCLVAAWFAGCKSDKDTSYSQITKHPAPEMRGLALRPADAHNAHKIADNQNWRMFSDDLSRTWLTGSPSRLSPYPVVNTGGPR